MEEKAKEVKGVTTKGIMYGSKSVLKSTLMETALKKEIMEARR